MTTEIEQKAKEGKKRGNERQQKMREGNRRHQKATEGNRGQQKPTETKAIFFASIASLVHLGVPVPSVEITNNDK